MQTNTFPLVQNSNFNLVKIYRYYRYSAKYSFWTSLYGKAFTVCWSGAKHPGCCLRVAGIVTQGRDNLGLENEWMDGWTSAHLWELIQMFVTVKSQSFSVFCTKNTQLIKNLNKQKNKIKKGKLVRKNKCFHKNGSKQPVSDQKHWNQMNHFV